MVIKSLTITEDAYEILKHLKHGDESFSDVILRIGKEKRDNIEKYFGIFKRSQAETEAMIVRVKDRRKEITKEFDERQARFKRLRER